MMLSNDENKLKKIIISRQREIAPTIYLDLFTKQIKKGLDKEK